MAIVVNKPPLIVRKIGANWPEDYYELKFNKVDDELNQNQFVVYCEEELAAKIALYYLKEEKL